jgi:hypothetical protein
MISYGEIRFDIRVLWITSKFPERIMLAIQGLTVSWSPSGPTPHLAYSHPSETQTTIYQVQANALASRS